MVEIRSVVFKIQEVEIGEILVRVNNTRVLRATFLAARHTTVCLNIVRVSHMKPLAIYLRRLSATFELMHGAKSV